MAAVEWETAMRPEIECVYESQDGLGEAPIWSEEERALYWSDHVGCTMKRWSADTGAVTVWNTPGSVGSFAFREEGGLVGATDSGFHRIDLDAAAYEQIVDPEAGVADNRFNDGKCDRRGRFWCGTMNKRIEAKTGSLYRLDPDFVCHAAAPDFRFTVSNGIAFDPEDTRMYFADTIGQAVYAFDFDIDSGEISNRREFFSTAERTGMVDGATVDQDGYYWFVDATRNARMCRCATRKFEKMIPASEVRLGHRVQLSIRILEMSPEAQELLEPEVEKCLERYPARPPRTSKGVGIRGPGGVPAH